MATKGTWARLGVYENLRRCAEETAAQHPRGPRTPKGGSAADHGDGRSATRTPWGQVYGGFYGFIKGLPGSRRADARREIMQLYEGTSRSRRPGTRAPETLLPRRAWRKGPDKCAGPAA